MGSVVGRREVESFGNRLIELVGRAVLDASGQQVITQPGKGRRFTVARSGSAGIYIITLLDKWVALDYVSVTTLVAAATPANRGGVWKCDAEDVATGRTITVRNELAALAGSPGVAVDPPNSSVLLIKISLDRGKI